MLTESKVRRALEAQGFTGLERADFLPMVKALVRLQLGSDPNDDLSSVLGKVSCALHELRPHLEVLRVHIRLTELCAALAWRTPDSVTEVLEFVREQTLSRLPSVTDKRHQAVVAEVCSLLELYSHPVDGSLVGDDVDTSLEEREAQKAAALIDALTMALMKV